MGYHTDFYGRFTLDRPLVPQHKAYLDAFANTRRMKRQASQTATYPDPIRKAVGLPIGEDAGYYVGAQSVESNWQTFKGQGHTPDIVDYNHSPSGQPGLWCQWVPNEDGTAIEWDGGEKFYDYTEWLAYLVEHFLKPWGYKLTGSVEWQGEERGDFGTIKVTKNKITVSDTSTHGRGRGR